MNLKRILSMTLATILSIGAVSGVYTEEVKASTDLTQEIYYNFRGINSANDMEVGRNYIFLNEKYNYNEAIAALPDGSAILGFAGTELETADFEATIPAEDQWTSNEYIRDELERYCSQKEREGYVSVLERGNGFDWCQYGVIAHTEQEGEIRWHYGCYAGGVAYVGPANLYQYDTATFTKDNLEVRVKDSFKAKPGVNVITIDDIVAVVDINGSKIDIPFIEILDSNNSIDSSIGDSTITIKVGNIIKDVIVKAKHKTPQGVLNSQTGFLEGLEANVEYEISVGKTTKKVMSNANGSIDVNTYAGKTIKLVRLGNENIGTSDAQVINIVIKTGTVDKEVQKGDGAPNATLDNSVEELYNSLLTAEEKDLAKSGVDVKIFLGINDITKTISNKEKNLLSSALKNNMKIGQYLDISLNKQIGNNGPIKITEVGENKIKITIELNENLINKNSKLNRKYTVLRNHNGVVELIEADYNDETKTITFETDKFSTYAIAYTDTESGKDEVPKTGERTNTGFLTLLAVISCAGVGLLSKKRL